MNQPFWHWHWPVSPILAFSTH